MKKPLSVILFSVFIILMGLGTAGLNAYFLLSPYFLFDIAWTPYYAMGWGILVIISGVVMMIGSREVVHVTIGVYGALLLLMGIVGKIFDMGIGGPLLQGVIVGILYKFNKSFGDYMDIDKKV